MLNRLFGLFLIIFGIIVIIFGNKKITNEKSNLFLEIFFESHKGNLRHLFGAKMVKLGQNMLKFSIGFFSIWFGLSFLFEWK